MTKEQAYLFTCDRCHYTLYSLRKRVRGAHHSVGSSKLPEGWIEMKACKEYPAKDFYQQAHYCSRRCYNLQREFRKTELEKAIMKFHPRAKHEVTHSTTNQ